MYIPNNIYPRRKPSLSGFFFYRCCCTQLPFYLRLNPMARFNLANCMYRIRILKYLYLNETICQTNFISHLHKSLTLFLVCLKALKNIYNFFFIFVMITCLSYEAFTVSYSLLMVNNINLP